MNITESSARSRGGGADVPIILGQDSFGGSLSCSANASMGAIREEAVLRSNFESPFPMERVSISTEWVTLY